MAVYITLHGYRGGALLAMLKIGPQVTASQKAYGIVTLTSVPFVRGEHNPAYSFRERCPLL